MRRDIGFIGLTFVAVSAMVGSGWLFAPLLASQAAGPASIVAWAIGGIAMLLLALTYAEISAMLPVAGGIARVPAIQPRQRRFHRHGMERLDRLQRHRTGRGRGDAQVSRPAPAMAP